VNQNKCESQIAANAKEIINNIDICVNEKGELKPTGHNMINSVNQVSIKRIKRHICHWPNCDQQFRQSSHLKQTRF